MLFDVMAGALASALGKPRDQDAITASGAKIRAAFAAGDVLAKETRLEVAGFLADHPDPDAVLRALRRFWHTDIMLLRAVAEPLPVDAVAVLRPNLEKLLAAVDALRAQSRKAPAPRLRLTSPRPGCAVSDRARCRANARPRRVAGAAARRCAPAHDLRLRAGSAARQPQRHCGRSQDLADPSGTAIPWLRP